VPEIDDFTFPQIVGENSAGTVLLSGTQRSTSRSGVFLTRRRRASRYLLPPPPATDRLRGRPQRARDVLATGRSDKDGHAVPLLWSTLAARPQVIDTPWTRHRPRRRSAPCAVRRQQQPRSPLARRQLIPLGGPGFSLAAGGIRGGHVIGTEMAPGPSRKSLVWHAPATPGPIEDGGTPRRSTRTA